MRKGYTLFRYIPSSILLRVFQLLQHVLDPLAVFVQSIPFLLKVLQFLDGFLEGCLSLKQTALAADDNVEFHYYAFRFDLIIRHVIYAKRKALVRGSPLVSIQSFDLPVDFCADLDSLVEVVSVDAVNLYVVVFRNCHFDFKWISCKTDKISILKVFGQHLKKLHYVSLGCFSLYTK